MDGLASPSNLDEFFGVSGSGGLVLLQKAVLLFLGRKPESTKDFKAIGARLAKAAKRPTPYDGYYIRAIMNKINPMTPPLRKASENLIAEILAEPPDLEYREVVVRVPNGIDIPEGTIILRDATTCICGSSFIPTIWNQINHTRACSFMRAKLRTR
jgi:hypothetical protein